MAEFETRETVVRHKEFSVPAPWPQGASIGALRRMMAAIERELTEVLGQDRAASDTAAWVVPGDNEITIRYKKPEMYARFGQCHECADPAVYFATSQEPGQPPGKKACSVHAAQAAAAGMSVTVFTEVE